MSTIIVSEQGIATDTQVTWGSQKMLTSTPKVYISPTQVFCATGDVGATVHIIERIYDGESPRSAVKKVRKKWNAEFEIAIATKEELEDHTMCYYSDHELLGHYVHFPVFLGSGADFARGAWEISFDPVSAVRVAGLCDINTGPEADFTKLMHVLDIMENEAVINEESYRLTTLRGNGIPRTG